MAAPTSHRRPQSRRRRQTGVVRRRRRRRRRGRCADGLLVNKCGARWHAPSRQQHGEGLNGRSRETTVWGAVGRRRGWLPPTGVDSRPPARRTVSESTLNFSFFLDSVSFFRSIIDNKDDRPSPCSSSPTRSIDGDRSLNDEHCRSCQRKQKQTRVDSTLRPENRYKSAVEKNQTRLRGGPWSQPMRILKKNRNGAQPVRGNYGHRGMKNDNYKRITILGT